MTGEIPVILVLTKRKQFNLDVTIREKSIRVSDINIVLIFD